MTKGERIFKQSVYLLIFVLVIFGISVGGYFYFSSTGDKIIPSEQDIAKPVEVVFVKGIRVGASDYDIVAKIANPNINVGSSRLEYKIKALDENGAAFEEIKGNTYILPGQTKYIVETPVVLSNEASEFRLEFAETNWQTLKDFVPQNLPLTVLRKEINFDESPQGNAVISGSIFNNSDFDLAQVDILGMAFDDLNNVIGVSKTDIRTFPAHTERDFTILLFDVTAGFERFDVEVYTNVFENSNFLRTYGDQTGDREL